MTALDKITVGSLVRLFLKVVLAGVCLTVGLVLTAAVAVFVGAIIAAIAGA